MDMTSRWARLSNRGVIRLSGGDCRTFLQGLVTNDIARLSAGRALYAALLTPQGKFLFDFLLYQDGETILLDGERSVLPELAKRLTLYKLRADVSIAPEPELEVVAAWPRAPAVAAAVAAHDPRHAELGDRLIGDAACFAALPSIGDEADYDAHRLALGIPDGIRDLIPNKTILLEAGFDALDGVSFDKGCFVGQELTARTKYRGLVKRRLLSVESDGEVPAAGTPVMAGDVEAGEMRSGRGNVGLAMLRLDRVAGKTEFSCGDRTLRLRPIGWQQL